MSNTETLRYILSTYPDALADKKRFQALIMDLFPGDKLTLNLIMIAYDCGINEINANIDNYALQLLYSQNMQKLVNDYGLSNEMAQHALSLWFDAKGLKLKEKETTTSSNTNSAIGNSDNLSVCIGKHNGFDITQNLAFIPHLFVCGCSGSGKTSFVQTIMTKLLFATPVPTVRFIVFDSQGADYSFFNDTGCLLIKTITQTRYIGKVLQWLQLEIQSRLNLFYRENLKDIYSYNSIHIKTGDILPSIFFVIDDFCSLKVDKEALSLLRGVLQNGRLAGIHLIIVTSITNSKILQNELLPSIPGRISFTSSSTSESQAIMGMLGAETLRFPGEMIFRSQKQILKCDASFFPAETIENMLQIAKGRITHADFQAEPVNSLEEYLDGKPAPKPQRKKTVTPAYTPNPSSTVKNKPPQRSTATKPTNHKVQKKKKKSGWLIFVVVIILLALLNKPDSKSSLPTSSQYTLPPNPTMTVSSAKEETPAEVTVEIPAAKSRPKSGTIYTDIYEEKSSKGVFTNNFDNDILVGCYYPKTGQTLLSFYLRAGETITCDMPYATLEIRVLNADNVKDYTKAFENGGIEYWTLASKIPFTINSTKEVIISEDVLQ